jgi:hypothetical protein
MATGVTQKLAHFGKPQALTGLSKTEFVISKLDQIVNWVHLNSSDPPPTN